MPRHVTGHEKGVEDIQDDEDNSRGDEGKASAMAAWLRWRELLPW